MNPPPSLAVVIGSFVGTFLFFGFASMAVGALVDGGGLERDPATSEAVILSRQQRPDSEGDDFFLTYEFRPSQQSLAPPPLFRNDVSVDHDTYVSHPPKSRVLIRYAKTDPSRSWLANDSSLSTVMMDFFMLFLAMFLLFGGLWGFVSSCFELWRLVLLTRCAQQVEALVVDRWEESDSEAGQLPCIAYSFLTSLGETHYAAEFNNDAYNKFKINDCVHVLYVPRHPSICKLKL